MTRLRLVCILVVLSGALGWAQRTVTFEFFQVSGTAVGLSDVTVNPPNRPPITACAGRTESGQMRVMDQRAGTVASTTGRVLEVGDTFDLATHDSAVNARFIRTGATDGAVHVECWQ